MYILWAPKAIYWHKMLSGCCWIGLRACNVSDQSWCPRCFWHRLEWQGSERKAEWARCERIGWSKLQFQVSIEWKVGDECGLKKKIKASQGVKNQWNLSGKIFPWRHWRRRWNGTLVTRQKHLQLNNHQLSVLSPLFKISFLFLRHFIISFSTDFTMWINLHTHTQHLRQRTLPVLNICCSNVTHPVPIKMADRTSIFRSRKLLFKLIILALIFISLTSISSYIKYRRKLFHYDLSRRLDKSIDALVNIEYSNKQMDYQVTLMKKILESLES